MSARIVVFAALILFSAGVYSEETTQTRLAKFGEELTGAWAAYPAEKDAAARKQKILDAGTAFTADLKELDAPANTTVKKALDNFTDNLVKAKTLFRLEKMNGERSTYITACSAAYKKDLSQATDTATEYPAHKCFDLLADWTDEARGRLRTSPDDTQTSLFNNINDIFLLMIKSATKDAGDATELYAAELKEIKRRFPITSPATQKLNQRIASLLEGAAKKVSDFNRKP